MAHTTYPSDLPVPVDDGACSHLTSTRVPQLSFKATDSSIVSLSTLPGLTIVFCYPRTGAPNEVVPDSWNSIPGARGCTPQACSFRDNLPELKNLGVTTLFGLSTQSTEYQQEVHERLHLPYQLLSDDTLEFVDALRLPTFDWEGKRVVRRLTLAVKDGVIVKHWYPVFPPDKNVDEVIAWLRESKA